MVLLAQAHLRRCYWIDLLTACHWMSGAICYNVAIDAWSLISSNTLLCYSILSLLFSIFFYTYNPRFSIQGGFIYETGVLAQRPYTPNRTRKNTV